MAYTRFTCTLTRANEPICPSYARVTITDSEGATARGWPRHAVAALDGIASARVDWADSKGLNQWERTALELSEERSQQSPDLVRRPQSGSDQGRNHVKSRRWHSFTPYVFGDTARTSWLIKCLRTSGVATTDWPD